MAHCSQGTSLVAQMVKNLLKCRRPKFSPWVRKIPWRSVWQPTPEFLPGEPYEQRSLVAYSPLGCKESDTTEQLTHTHTHTHIHTSLSEQYLACLVAGACTHHSGCVSWAELPHPGLYTHSALLAEAPKSVLIAAKCRPYHTMTFQATTSSHCV